MQSVQATFVADCGWASRRSSKPSMPLAARTFSRDPDDPGSDCGWITRPDIGVTAAAETHCCRLQQLTPLNTVPAGRFVLHSLSDLLSSTLELDMQCCHSA